MNSSPAPCPDENALSAWAVGASAPEDAIALSAHIEECLPCRRAFADVVTALRVGEASTWAAQPALVVPAEAPSIEPGALLMGKFEVIRPLGTGGMGVVVQARHVQLNTQVALKFIRPELAHQPEVLSRFSREARAAARLESRHVNRVLDLGVLPGGLPFIVMEYLEGETLEARLRRMGPLSVAQTIEWTRQVLLGLHEAHALGIVHRDLKPANLFIRRREGGLEELVILDFGIAKSVHPDIEVGLHETTHSRLVGSPVAMAPEQLVPKAEVDARADVWAVGCTMVCMLTGQPPFSGTDLVDLAWRIRNSPTPTWPASFGALGPIIDRCLQKKPEERYQTVGDLEEALKTAAAVPSSVAPKWGRVALALAALLAVLIASGVGLRTRRPTSPVAVAAPLQLSAPAPVQGVAPLKPAAEPLAPSVVVVPEAAPQVPPAKATPKAVMKKPPPAVEKPIEKRAPEEQPLKPQPGPFDERI